MPRIISVSLVIFENYVRKIYFLLDAKWKINYIAVYDR
jgi:hypothetical protein